MFSEAEGKGAEAGTVERHDSTDLLIRLAHIDENQIEHAARGGTAVFLSYLLHGVRVAHLEETGDGIVVRAGPRLHLLVIHQLFVQLYASADGLHLLA